jgi:uncharacterized protein (TIGR02246 family)
MFERYTQKARRVIFFARYEASQYGSAYIETEHLLLGILREDRPLGAKFINEKFGEQSVRNEIESEITRGERLSTSIEMPLSADSKKVLIRAADEASRLGEKHVGTEHLLLGILLEPECLAAKILLRRGVTLERIREELALASAPSSEKGSGEEPFSLSQFMNAWSLGNAADFARSFAPEGQFVDPLGNLWVGPGRIHKAAKLIFTAPGWGTCPGKIEDVNFVGGKAIVATLAWEAIEKAEKPNPACVRMTVILTQKPEGWSIARVQATGLQPRSHSAAV